MADLSKVIDYEKTYPIKIKTPDGEDLGITINVVSKDSKRVVSALRDFQADVWDAAVSAGVAEEQVEETWREKLKRIESHGIATIIACIDSWDWGDHNFEHISGSGPASYADREFMVRHANSQWIVDQIAGPVNALENFSQPLPKSARSGSKKT